MGGMIIIKTISSKRELQKTLVLSIFFCMCVLGTGRQTLAQDSIRAEFFYQEVCASCDGTTEFFEIYKRSFTPEEQAELQVDFATYNVFLESNKEYYRKRVREQGIPVNEPLPILVVGESWVSGYEAIEKSLREFLLKGGIEKSHSEDLKDLAEEEKVGDENAASFAKKTADFTARAGTAALVLFTTDSCKECTKVKEWLGRQPWFGEHTVVEWNIIQDDCLSFLQRMFYIRQVEEVRQKVPAVFVGNQVLTGAKEILSLTEEQLLTADQESLQELLMAVEAGTGEFREDLRLDNLLTLAGAGLLAGLNPCSISLLLMLLSLFLETKVSIWKNGLLYLAGKYIVYFSIGMVIFFTASQISQKTLDRADRILDVILAVLFLFAAALYFSDARRIFRQDYGHIRTQLPIGLRKANHDLIRKLPEISGVTQPLLIFGLGAAIALGEFFCTGQIYMASITYLLKSRIATVWLPFVVYVTAMSLPALVMILLIWRTRNANRISAFMFQHLGAIKICTAVLFLGFAIYFLAG